MGYFSHEVQNLTVVMREERYAGKMNQELET